MSDESKMNAHWDELDPELKHQFLYDGESAADAIRRAWDFHFEKKRNTPTGVCVQCKRRINWAEQRKQFGRLIKKGFSKEQVKSIMPRCQKCVTKHLEELAASKPSPSE